MCANIKVFIYFMISYGKYIAILYHYLTFPVNTRVRSPSVAGANSLHFLSVTRKKTEAKERVRKRPASEAVCPILVATQWARFAQTAFRISLLVLHSKPRLNMAPKIVQSLKTSSCGVFSIFAAPVEAQKRKGVAGAAPSSMRQPRVTSGTCDGPSLP
ncbi:hypothetical protein SAMN04487850_0372 [Prevotella aff. ruminicola Tc2-24]|uniref:Uncharacterized protein n=1 Tax=Prevotella aff. ruminicola Tc2-24 TaxID=81582 RepID=A0A1I0M6J3_9BACT|nr:hypothetical protein SAMN04487850_0372 [Prevotella aff. ruminicola Tc2-24]